MTTFESFSRRPATPRRVRNGVRLPRAGVPEVTTWVAERVLRVLDVRFDPDVRRDGLTYAERGQTINLEFVAGVVRATVQGRNAEPYATTWGIEVIDESGWERLVDRMASEALYEAKLRANELPPSISRLFESEGLAVVPHADELDLNCNCPGMSGDAPRLCKHLAAVGYLIVERLEREPLWIFTWRGSPHILPRLARARAVRSHGTAAAHADALAPSEADAVPLEALLEHFWRPGPTLEAMRELPPPHHAAHALLRRLGPSPLPGRFPLAGLLASVYDSVTAWAEHLRDRAERLEDQPD